MNTFLHDDSLCPPAPATQEAPARLCLGHLKTLTAAVIAIVSTLVLMLAGCASSAGIARVAAPLPAARIGLDSPVPAALIAADWWRNFNDPALVDLVDRALADSPNLKAAQARLARAESAVANARSADGPQLNGGLDLTRQRFTENGIYPRPLAGATLDTGTLQLNGSWEFDFFGRNRAAIEAAVGTQRAAEADAQAARVLLAANVARSYVQLARLVELREVARRSLDQRAQVLGLIQQRVRGGIDTNVELRQGEGALPESRQQIEQFDEQITLTRHALAALTLQPPDALGALAPALQTVQMAPLPTAVPADLIGRRADITAARWRIEAAAGDVDVAKAQFYPNVNLTAFLGLSSIGFDHLLKSGSEQWGVGPAIRLPIFTSGRLRANLRGRTADLDNAIEVYNGAIVDAVREVADQISSLQSITRQAADQANAQNAAESAYDLATQRYRAGLGTYLVVLNAETTVLAQRRLSADLRARALDGQVALIRALGGGYVPGTNLPRLAAVGS